MINMSVRFLVLFSVWLIATSQTNLNEPPATEVENYQIQSLIKEVKQKEIQQKIETRNKEDRKNLEDLENAEAKKVVRAIDRKERIKKYKTFITTEDSLNTKVAIIGQSALELSANGYDAEILSDLLEIIKQDNPKAIFLAGNSLSSLVSSSDLSNDKNPYIELPSIKNIFNETFEKEKGYYQSSHFKKTLDNFVKFLQKKLGSDIPIYPVMGAQESIGPNTAEIFQQAFSLYDALVLKSNQLVYTITIENALFLMLSTDYFDKATGQIKLGSLADDAKKWLEDTLERRASKYDFVFVIASDPIFSTTSSFGIYSGLDKNKIERDSLWELLMKYKVRAYFCGGEVLYDRSYRKRGWQIITGGGGTPRGYLEEKEDTFYHFLVLSLPKIASKDPLVQVYNSDGIIQDQFLLSKTQPLLYQFRISHQDKVTTDE